MKKSSEAPKSGYWSMRFQLGLVRMVHLFGNSLLGLARLLLFRPVRHPGRILIFRTGSFGDSLCAIPAIRSVRKGFPEAQIVLLTNTGHPGQQLVSIDQLLPDGVVDEVFQYEGVSRPTLIRNLRRRRFDAVIQLPQYNAPWYRLLRDMVIFRLFCRITTGFGWQWDHIHFFCKVQESAGPAENERQRLLNLLARNGVEPLPESAFALPLTEQDRRIAAIRLQELPQPEKPVIGMVVGAKRPQNRWPLAYFEAVCRHFTPGFNIVLIGGPDDRALAGLLQKHDGVYSLCGALSPMQNAWIMKNCRLILANDTGPMHLAYAVGAPLIALFSARDLPGRWYPPAEPSNLVFRQAGIPCSVCLSETCNDNICMKNIKPDAVIAAMNQLLQEPDAC